MGAARRQILMRRSHGQVLRGSILEHCEVPQNKPNDNTRGSNRVRWCELYLR
jgi:hypothetical protein